MKIQDLQESLSERLNVCQHQAMTLTCMQDGFCGVDLDREMMILIVMTFELLNNSTPPDVPQFDLCQFQRTARNEEQSKHIPTFRYQTDIQYHEYIKLKFRVKIL